MAVGRSEQRCRESLHGCRMQHQVKAETWSVGTVILIAGAALVAGILVGGGTVLMIK